MDRGIPAPDIKEPVPGAHEAAARPLAKTGLLYGWQASRARYHCRPSATRKVFFVRQVSVSKPSIAQVEGEMRE
jgi:hypothetical protein